MYMMDEKREHGYRNDANKKSFSNKNSHLPVHQLFRFLTVYLLVNLPFEVYILRSLALSVRCVLLWINLVSNFINIDFVYTGMHTFIYSANIYRPTSSVIYNNVL